MTHSSDFCKACAILLAGAARAGPAAKRNCPVMMKTATTAMVSPVLGSSGYQQPSASLGPRRVEADGGKLGEGRGHVNAKKKDDLSERERSAWRRSVRGWRGGLCRSTPLQQHHNLKRSGKARARIGEVGRWGGRAQVAGTHKTERDRSGVHRLCRLLNAARSIVLQRPSQPRAVQGVGKHVD